MIPHFYGGICASCFSINIGDVRRYLIGKNGQVVFFHGKIWKGFKNDIETSVSRCCCFSKGDFLSLTIRPRTTPTVPSRVLYITLYAIDNFGIGYLASRKSQCITCNRDTVIDFIGFRNGVKVGFKLGSLVFFYRKACAFVYVTFL